MKPLPLLSRVARAFSARLDWLTPAGLVALSLVPTAAGTLRMIELLGCAEVAPDNARFVAAPLPVVLHVVSAVMFCVVGAFQFSSGLRRRRPGWHRAGGRVIVPCGLVAALSGLWMTQFYPAVEFDGPSLYALRLLAGSAMASSLCLGVAAIKRRDLSRHRAWMTRGYALGMGAGTQVFTHLPWFLFPGIQGELARTLFMGAGWAINLAAAEWSIARERRACGKPRGA
jgi:uncharacterized membrane protein